MATQPRHLYGLLAFFDPLLRRSPLVVEPHYRSAEITKTQALIQLAHQNQTAVHTPNHIGVICTNGTGRAPEARNLLDLFQVKIDPLNGLADIVYSMTH